MELKERIKLFCDLKNIAISTFEKQAGLSNGYFNSVKKRPSASKLRGIIDGYPELNPQWLLTGQGSMLRTDTAPILSNNTNSNLSNTINDSTLIDALSEQLRVANEQLRQKDEQLKHAHEQLTEKDKQISQLFALLSAK